MINTCADSMSAMDQERVCYLLIEEVDLFFLGSPLTADFRDVVLKRRDQFSPILPKISLWRAR